MSDENEILAQWREGRGAIARALAVRPEDPERHLAECVRALVRVRDLLIAKRRAGADAEVQNDDGLRFANATISLLASCEHPIQGTRWTRIESARDAVEELGRRLGA